MNSNETHDRLSRMMMPGADPKVIYRVNRAMDHPDVRAIALNNYMKQSGHAHAFDILWLRKYGHREPNHNWMSAMMTGLYVRRTRRNVRSCSKPPYTGSHERYMLIRTMGYAGRDLFGSMVNYGPVVNYHSTEEEGGRSGVGLVL